jgi:hypothetical protein
MSIEEGLRRVDDVARQFDRDGVRSPEVFGQFAAAVMEYADNSGLVFRSPPDCRTDYDTHKPEIQMWYFGLMICEYVAGLFAQKVEEGHCNQHRKEPDLTECPKTRPTHLNMLRAFRCNLATLVSQIDDRIRDLSRLPQS